MSTLSAFPYIPQARPAPIDDRLLAQLARVGEDARIGMATEAEAEWLLSVTGPLLRELLARRQAEAALQTAQPAQNVITIGKVR